MAFIKCMFMVAIELATSVLWWNEGTMEEDKSKVATRVEKCYKSKISSWHTLDSFWENIATITCLNLLIYVPFYSIHSTFTNKGFRDESMAFYHCWNVKRYDKEYILNNFLRLIVRVELCKLCPKYSYSTGPNCPATCFSIIA